MEDLDKTELAIIFIASSVDATSSHSSTVSRVHIKLTPMNPRESIDEKATP